MEPFFLLCLNCHHAYVWHHRSDDLDCPEGCGPHYIRPWFLGFGPDETPIPRHRSVIYGDGESLWPKSNEPVFYVHNAAEMKEKCR